MLKGLEVLELDVLEDDAIFDLRPEGPRRRAISVVARRTLTRVMLTTGSPILGNPGATSRDDAIFLGESLLQEQESPWELAYVADGNLPVK